MRVTYRDEWGNRVGIPDVEVTQVEAAEVVAWLHDVRAVTDWVPVVVDELEDELSTFADGDDEEGDDMSRRLRLTIHQDYDAERPDAYEPVRLVSFDRHHINYRNPDTLTEQPCSVCDGYGERVTDDDDDTGAPVRAVCEVCGGAGYLDGPLASHPDVVALLSYYEHGLSRWMVGPSTVPDYGGFDTRPVGGAVVYAEAGDDGSEAREWFDGLGDVERTAYLEGLAERFTEWANGAAYVWRVEPLAECPTCGHVDSVPGDDEPWRAALGDDELGAGIAEGLEALGCDVGAVVEVAGDMREVWPWLRDRVSRMVSWEAGRGVSFGG